MSTQWETAKHCYRALSLLSRNMHETNTTSEPSPNKRRKVDYSSSSRPRNPQDPTTTTMTDHLPTTHTGPTNPGEEEQEEHTRRRRDHGANTTTNIYHDNTTTTTAQIPDLNDTDFDFNIVDLLQGSNFDDLTDMFGQQYPTF